MAEILCLLVDEVASHFYSHKVPLDRYNAAAAKYLILL
jgi:hypothetical protein